MVGRSSTFFGGVEIEHFLPLVVPDEVEDRLDVVWSHLEEEGVVGNVESG